MKINTSQLVIMIVELIVIGITFIHNVPNYVIIPLLVLQILFIFALIFAYYIDKGIAFGLAQAVSNIGHEPTTTTTSNSEEN